MLRSSLSILKHRAPFRYAVDSAFPRRSSRHFATLTDLGRFPKAGDKLHGFTLKRSKHFPELELSALELHHDKTGAQYLHLAREDSNNVFSIGFKTNPPDATGVPHILEHTTLCGSKRYPVRDPFFKMLPRSLSNFMNAFTFSDHTRYPFATTNAQDFKNLMSVYLDATLHPLLNAHDFSQEGWRIGPENPTATDTSRGKKGGDDLVFKGVVYNEMKGEMSDASVLFLTRFHEHIIPALNNSGGDPQKITDLTHEQLTDFHRQHYHPSNAKISTYGDMPLDVHLEEIGARLDAFKQIPVDEDVKLPTKLCGPKTVTIPGPVDPLVPADSQFKTSVSWLAGSASDSLNRFSLSILSSLLLGGYGSPLYRGLIEAGLGSDFTPNSGFDTSTMIPIFSVGLTGVKKENVTRVKETIQRVLSECSKNGFDRIKVDGQLHQVELSLKHKTANFGMSIMNRIQPDWFNGLDPFNALAWQDTVKAFREAYAKGRYLEDLLANSFLNDNTLTFTMTPCDTYSTDLAAEETTRLATKVSEMVKQFTSEDKAYKHLAQRELELLKAQEDAANQDLSCLPTLHVVDIPRETEPKHLRFSTLDGVNVQWREAPTNGLTYFRAIQPLVGIPPMMGPSELRGLIPLFCDTIMRLGTKNKSMEQLEELICLRTGGVSLNYHLASSPLALDTYEEGFILSGHALDSNVPAMYELFRTLVRETNFDGPKAERRIRELLQTSANGAVDAIASSGHAYARMYAEAGLSLPALLREQTSGLTQVKLTAGMAARSASESLQDVVGKLKAIQQLVLDSRQSMRVAINCSAESVEDNEAALSKFLSTIPSSPSNLTATPIITTLPPLHDRKSFFTLPYQVSYTAIALASTHYTHPRSPGLQILAQLLTHKHLHREIREKGGAYGGGAYANPLGGVIGFSSYRDPNPANTLDVISRVGKWAMERDWSDEEVGEAKLSVFQGIDAPRSVSEEGMERFLCGVDDGMLRDRRVALLDVTREDLRLAAQECLVEGAEKMSYVVLGPKKEWVTESWRLEDLGAVSTETDDVATTATA